MTGKAKAEAERLAAMRAQMLAQAAQKGGFGGYQGEGRGKGQGRGGASGGHAHPDAGPCRADGWDWLGLQREDEGCSDQPMQKGRPGEGGTGAKWWWLKRLMSSPPHLRNCRPRPAPTGIVLDDEEGDDDEGGGEKKPKKVVYASKTKQQLARKKEDEEAKKKVGTGGVCVSRMKNMCGYMREVRRMIPPVLY